MWYESFGRGSNFMLGYISVFARMLNFQPIQFQCIDTGLLSKVRIFLVDQIKLVVLTLYFVNTMIFRLKVKQKIEMLLLLQF